MEIFGPVFFVLFANVSAVIGAAYYHFAWGVGKMKRELADAKEKLAALERRSGTTPNDAVKAA
jgi:hypothetical protein